VTRVCFCQRCGGETDQRKQLVENLVLTWQICSLCGDRIPVAQHDLEASEVREFDRAERGVNNWLPEALRGKRLQCSAVPVGVVYQVTGYSNGWSHVRIGVEQERSAWVAPGGRLLVEVLEVLDSGD
jgi:hypothetical protein